MIKKYIQMTYKSRAFSKRQKLLLIFITTVGAIIRIAFLYNRPFIDDEIGTLMYIEKDIPYLLSHFHTWLSMNYFIVAEKIIAIFFGKGTYSLGALPLIAGICTIPLTAFLAARFTSPQVSLIAAILVATNHFLIEYSGTIRAYSLLASLSIIAIILFFRWREKPDYKRGIFLSAACYFLVIVHPNGVYTLAYIVLLAFLDFMSISERQTRNLYIRTFALPLMIVIFLIFISYFKLFPHILKDGERWHDIPPTSISYVPYIFSQYFAGGFYGWLSALFFISAVFITFKHENPLFILLPGIVIPILLMSIQGLSQFPWAYSRFLIFIVPLIIIFIAEGIHIYSSRLTPSKQLLSITICVVAIILTWTPNILTTFGEKFIHPWNKMAQLIKAKYQEGDIILCNYWDDLNGLRPYFPESKYRILVLRQYFDSIQKDFVGKAFFVTHDTFLTTMHSNFNLGNIQVVVYPLKGKDTLQMIRNDFVKTVKDKKIDPALTEFYKNTWALNRKLGIKNNFVYYRLWVKCNQLTVAQRNIPLKLQAYQLRSHNKKDG